MIGVGQAAVALLQGTEDCSIPHNTMELDCSGSMDWVVDMMAEVTHHMTRHMTHISYCRMCTTILQRNMMTSFLQNYHVWKI